MAADEGPALEESHTHLARSGKTALTLEQLAQVQPGLASLMLEVGNRFWRCYHAAQAENRRLARFQLSEGTKLLKRCAIVRPQYGEDISGFIETEVASLRTAIEAGDWAGFSVAFSAMTESVNRLHEVWNHGYLVWKVPEQPPTDLVLTPRPEDR